MKKISYQVMDHLGHGKLHDLWNRLARKLIVDLIKGSDLLNVPDIWTRKIG